MIPYNNYSYNVTLLSAVVPPWKKNYDCRLRLIMRAISILEKKKRKNQKKKEKKKKKQADI